MTCAHCFINHYAIFHSQTRRRSELGSRAHACAKQDEACCDPTAVGQDDLAFAVRLGLGFEVKKNTIFLMKFLDQPCKLRTEYALQGQQRAANDMNFDAPTSQGRGSFQPEEARTDNNNAVDVLQ